VRTTAMRQFDYAAIGVASNRRHRRRFRLGGIGADRSGPHRAFPLSRYGPRRFAAATFAITASPFAPPRKRLAGLPLDPRLVSLPGPGFGAAAEACKLRQRYSEARRYSGYRFRLPAQPSAAQRYETQSDTSSSRTAAVSRLVAACIFGRTSGNESSPFLPLSACRGLQVGAPRLHLVDQCTACRQESGALSSICYPIALPQTGAAPESKVLPRLRSVDHPT
jgi:hypothetical protein